MSNKVVPPIYRTVIDDVIASIRPAFEEFGVHEDKWEAKVIASRVADFEPPQPPPAAAHHPYHRAHQIDPRYALAAAQYALPPLPGPAFPGLGGLGGGSGGARCPSTPRRCTASRRRTGPPEAINSDLDDSDTENEEDPEEATVETDIVFCTYDRVARVKNKWKCVLKDGMIHTGGKDYLFQRCTGEFEW
ncbi:transcription factor IIA, alpha/beta subunit-domain-containing protein [Mycena leptocephala]|nr:transcription factor IIA, alpha/beta subunit-domain-containing protein [Mycena leptocephala]